MSEKLWDYKCAKHHVLCGTEELLRDYVPGASSLQMESFVVRKAGFDHPFGSYVQALRELHARERALRHRYLELRRLTFWHHVWYWLPLPGRNYRCQKLALEIQAAQESQRDQVRERDCYLNLARRLKRKVGDLSDPAVRAAAELDFWWHRILFGVALARYLGVPPDASLLEGALRFPDGARERLLEKLRDPDALRERIKDLLPAAQPAGFDVELKTRHALARGEVPPS